MSSFIVQFYLDWTKTLMIPKFDDREALNEV